MLFYVLNFENNRLHILDFDTGIEKIFNNSNSLDGYRVINNQQTILVKSIDSTHKLACYNYKNGKYKVIFNGNPIREIVLSPSQNFIVFTIQGNNGTEIWQYRFSQGKASLLLSNNIDQFANNEKIFGVKEISNDDKYLFFTTYNPGEHLFSSDSYSKKNGSIWTYRDKVLTPARVIDGIRPERHLYCYQIRKGLLTNICYDETDFMGYRGDLAMVTCINDSISNYADKFGNPPNINLINLNNKDDRKCIVPSGSFSALGKFLLFFNSKKNSYYTYDTKSGALHNITPNIRTYWRDYYDDYIGSDHAGDGREIWLNNDSNLIITDRYDVWLLDPKGIRPPINLTNGYGRKTGISFYTNLISTHEKLNNGSTLILVAFNHNSKENGFYQVTIGANTDPQRLTMSNNIFFTPKSTVLESGDVPKKASNVEVWLVKKLSSQESPNYCITNDFKNFRSVTNLHPEAEYLWYTNELIFIDSVDDRKMSGVLYRPPAFDSTKKYPVVFYYYEKMSDNLNTYMRPKLTSGLLNIPWFTSHGYLVFTPDIFYTIGEPGESALKWVLKGKDAVIKLPYVDSSKIGLYGHSFGGYETNYIITHSNTFTAACSASGVSNLISEYGTIAKSGYSLQSLVEIGQVRLGQSLWDNNKLYIDNSPIFFLGNVSTPLLIMHTENDGMAPLEQATQLFTGLWRLKKKSWMLLYKNQNHNLGDKESIYDFDTRLLQFYDHYLKDKPAPKWMTNDNSKILLDPSNGLEIDITSQNP